MRDELLSYYERELTFLRQLGADFAEKYPKIANRLVLEPDRCEDPHVERLISEYRTLSGNVPVQRRSAARDILKALRRNEAVGILFDQNTTRSEGVFAEFFGVPAATTPSIALLALRTGAAVVPGFLIWDEKLRKHRLRLDPPVELINTGNLDQDVLENTKVFNKILESYVRKCPDHWLWIHRRWKTRPEGEPSLY